MSPQLAGALLMFGFGGTDAAASAAPYPPDPFAQEYRIPEAREVGTTAGQARAMGAGALALGQGALAMGASGTLELMTFAYLGVRGATEGLFAVKGGGPSMVAVRVGPSLHLLPYSRIDLSSYLEAGVTGFDLLAHGATAAPIVTPGGAIDVWLDPVWFLHLDAHVDWAVYAAGASARDYLRFVGAAGLGVGF